jgi:preprotein translocase subunit SecG
MNVLNIVLLVFFVIVAVLLILLVLVQNEEGDSLGGIFSGGSGSAFGSRSGNVLTRTTSILGARVLVISFSLALLNRSPGVSGVEAAGRQQSTQVEGDWWQEEGSGGSSSVTPEFAVPVPELPAGTGPEAEPLE